MAVPQLPQVLINTPGNSKNEKAIASVVEAQIKGIMANEKATLAFYATATAEQIAVINGAGLAIYRIPRRLKWGIQYDADKGAPHIRPGVNTIAVPMNKKFTIKWSVEDFDMETFINSPLQVRSGLLAEWVASMTNNALYNMDATFLQAVKDYCLADNQFYIKDIGGLVGSDKGQEVFYDINKLVISNLQKVTDNYFGTNQNDYIIGLGFSAYAGLTTAYTQVMGTSTGVETLGSGKLYSNAILGTAVLAMFYLEMDFIATNDDSDTDNPGQTAINQDVSYKFENFIGFVLNKKMWAFPMSFKVIRQVIDNDTGNLKWMGKILVATPTVIYPGLCTAFFKKQPTQAEIDEAVANKGKTFELPWYYDLKKPKTDISSISTVSPPASVTATTVTAVTEAEIHTVLDPQVLKAVQGISSSLTASDYDYTIKKGDGSALPIDLTASAPVKVKITGKGNATGATGDITVQLPVATASSKNLK